MNFSSPVPRLRGLVAALVSLLLSVEIASAGVPKIIHYQGRVTVGGNPFTGTGSFRFALVNGTGSASYWSHDGTSAGGSEPTSAVSLPVVNGRFMVPLGDTTLTNMAALDAAVFTHEDVRVRVWFDDGSNGSERLVPDQRITSVGYALMAETVTDGSVTSEKLADDIEVSGSVTAGSFVGDGSQLTGIDSSSGQSIFIRWGSAQAPTGTTLVYSGFAFGPNPAHPGGGGPVVLAGGDPGASELTNGSELYPMATGTGVPMPAGIPADRLVKAAVCLADGPTTVIWGNWTPPTGWSLLYKGYAAGAAFSSQGNLNLICLDADNFDSSVPPGVLGTLDICGRLLVSRTAISHPSAPTNTDYPGDRYVKAAVIVKNPAP